MLMKKKRIFLFSYYQPEWIRITFVKRLNKGKDRERKIGEWLIRTKR